MAFVSDDGVLIIQFAHIKYQHTFYIRFSKRIGEDQKFFIHTNIHTNIHA